jgi:hypothetical protein
LRTASITFLSAPGSVLVFRHVSDPSNTAIRYDNALMYLNLALGVVHLSFSM